MIASGAGKEMLTVNEADLWRRIRAEAEVAGYRPVTISGAPADDAKHYQVRAVRLAIEESRR